MPLFHYLWSKTYHLQPHHLTMFLWTSEKYHIKIPGGNANAMNISSIFIHPIGVFLLWTNMIRNTKHNVEHHDTPCPIASGGKLPHPFLTEHTFTWKWETKRQQMVDFLILLWYCDSLSHCLLRVFFEFQLVCQISCIINQRQCSDFYVDIATTFVNLLVASEWKV